MAQINISVGRCKWLAEGQKEINEIYKKENELAQRIRELKRDLAGMKRQRLSVLRDMQETLYADLIPEIKQIAANDRTPNSWTYIEGDEDHDEEGDN